MRKFSDIKQYKETAFRGDLNLNCNFAVRSIEQCAEASLRDPVTENFVGKFLYFYMDRPKIQNPITCRVGKKFAVIHPGQGRALAAFFRKQPTIDSIFILLGQDLEAELEKIKETALNFKKSKSLLFQYGRYVSTINFRNYYDLDSTKNQRYMQEIRSAIVRYLSHDLLPIQWEFESTKQITLGQGKPRTLIKCKNAIGFYESIIHLVDDKDLQTERFKVVKY